MENINGSLGFRATLDIDDFNVSAQAMERRIRDVSNTAVAESAAMEDAVLRFARNGAKYITSFFVGQGMKSLLESIIQTRGQFQQLEIAFETMLGSGTKAKALMDQLVDTAAKTPFDLAGVAGGAKQLLAYGESADKVNDTLVRLGNIASGLSIPLNDIVYLYGTTMVQGRLYAQDVRQFTGRGIPLVKELADMYGVTAQEINEMVSAGKIGFPDVEKVLLKLTDAGGRFYNLMEKQSASLTGQISNLGDAWDMALNRIGENNQDLFSGAISGATYLVEHMEEILRIVEAITIAYGSYRAAIALNTFATKGYTGVALLDNTVRQAKLALMKMDAAITGQVTAQTKMTTAAQEAHVASLQKQLTAEENANLVKQLRIATINSFLTAQQREYLSNIGLTTSSQGYEAAAMGVLTVEQREALSKTDLTAKSAIYRAALEQEVARKTQNQAASIAAMRAEVSAAAAKVEAAKQTAIATIQATEAARYEVHWAKQSGDAHAIATAQKKLEAAQDNQSLARKAALAAQTDFYTKKKALEAATTRQATTASAADTAAKGAQTTATNLLSTATTKVTLAMKTLWAAMKTNPLGWILSIIGLVISAFTLFFKKEEEATDAMGEFQETTRKQIGNLDLLFDILQNTERGTKTHKDAIEKVNAICKEYNKTLLDENATLDAQKLKYEELTVAIQQTTAEKIKAKYVEQEMQKYLENSDKSFENFNKNTNNATYDTGRTRAVMKRTTGGDSYEVPIYESAEHIQNMIEAVREAIRSKVEDNSKNLATLTGDAYTEEYSKVLASIMSSTQSATKATDAEMAGFRSVLVKYLDDQIGKVREMNSAVSQVESSLSNFYAPKETPVAESVDYVTMTFEDLDQKAKETQAEIDAINAKTVKVETDNTKLEELKGVLNQVNSAITAKTENLDTEAGISARVKQLKEERSNVEINSAKYKELTNTINKLEARMPRTTGRSTANQSDQYARKQLEADMKLEEDRISVMEEGYEKRKALLDLQHKQALARIDKEEEELAKARRAAGKGDLSENERSGFNERRSIENQSYQKQQNTLFDGEIAYKKKQYELYFRWVRNMGEDIANKQFASLLKNGRSFKSYIEQQIATLTVDNGEPPTERQGRSDLSEGEVNMLDQLKAQYNEITGVKSAMDAFKDSVTATINRAATLAERVQAIADAKKRLENGSSGLVGDDEKAEASLFLSEKQAEADKEIQEKILTNYKTYEEQKKAIQDEYALLRQQAIAQGNEEALAKLQQGESEALSALNASSLMQSESWKNLFSDMDALTVEQIDKLVREIQDKLNTADMNLNPADMQAVLNRLDQAKKKILDVNPFKALGRALTDVFQKQTDGSKKATDQIRTDWSNLADATEDCFSFVNDAIDSCDVLGDLLGDTGKSTIQILQGVTTAGIAMASAIATAEKGSVILASISIALQAIQWIVGLFNNDDELQERIEKIQRDVDALSNSFDRLQHAYDQTFWVWNDDEKAAHQQRLQSIKEEIAALEQQAVVAKQSWRFSEYARLTKQIKELKHALEKEEQSGDMFEIYELQKQNLKEQQELIEQQIQAEKDKKNTDLDKIAEWEEAIKDIDTQLEDLERDMLETLAGTTIENAIDEFADALVDAYCQGEDAAKALGEVTKNTLKNAVVEALKRNFLAKAINDAILYLGEAMEDGELSATEKSKFEAMVNAAGKTFNTALEGIGDWIKDLEEEEEADPLTGAVTSMSEETGGVIAGRLNAFIINQSDQLVIMRQNLAYQAEIAANSKICANELVEVKATLKRIENKDSSLLSQGIS